jgi:hypothetical protein
VITALRLLALEKVASSMIGDVFVRGLSGQRPSRVYTLKP